MNLVAYDNVNTFVPSDNYIQNSYKRLLSSTIEYHDVYCLLKRYNVDKDKYDFYVAVYDNKQQKNNDTWQNKEYAYEWSYVDYEQRSIHGWCNNAFC